MHVKSGEKGGLFQHCRSIIFSLRNTPKQQHGTLYQNAIARGAVKVDVSVDGTVVLADSFVHLHGTALARFGVMRAVVAKRALALVSLHRDARALLVDELGKLAPVPTEFLRGRKKTRQVLRKGREVN